MLAKGFGGWSAEKVGEFSRIVLSMTDAQATYESLRDRGVTFSEPPTAQPWGTGAVRGSGWQWYVLVDWWAAQDSNLEPSRYERRALPLS